MEPFASRFFMNMYWYVRYMCDFFELEIMKIVGVINLFIEHVLRGCRFPRENHNRTIRANAFSSCSDSRGSAYIPSGHVPPTFQRGMEL